MNTMITALKSITADELEDDDLLLISDIRCEYGPTSKSISIGELRRYFMICNGWNRLLQELKMFPSGNISKKSTHSSTKRSRTGTSRKAKK